MPALNVSDPSGRSLNLGALQGTPVLVNLWATWCAPCVKEMPLLDTLAADLSGGLRGGRWVGFPSSRINLRKRRIRS